LPKITDAGWSMYVQTDCEDTMTPSHFLIPVKSSAEPLTSPGSLVDTPTTALREKIADACNAWLLRSPSKDTRTNYAFDLRQFLAFAEVSADRPELLAKIRPHQVAAWRDHLKE
jgi:hypothetical protein